MSDGLKNWLWGGGAVVALMVITGGLGALGDDDKKDRGLDRAPTASRICQEAAAARLKVPSSAEFSGIATTRVGDTYTVAGVMGGANALGGVVGHDFECRAQVTDDTNSVLSVTVAPR